jgi:hypothetical protein
MMRSLCSSLWPCLLGLAALPACSGGDPSSGNPATLWLAPLGNETHVQLVADKPPMF